MIIIRDDASFDETILFDYVSKSGRNYIVQGQQNNSFIRHTKPHSLDYWLRQNFAHNRDTKQAENTVIEALVASGLFIRASRLKCPDSGSYCKGIQLA